MTAREALRIVLSFTLIAVGSSACKDKSASNTSATAAASARAPKVRKVLKVGDMAVTKDYKLTVQAVKVCRHRYYFSEAKRGSVWFGVRVAVQSVAARPIYSNPGSGKILDEDGGVHQATFQVTKDCNPALGDVRLAKGEKATGWIVFEVSKHAKTLKFSYGDAERVKFELVR